jgi:hypothetical protein
MPKGARHTSRKRENSIEHFVTYAQLFSFCYKIPRSVDALQSVALKAYVLAGNRPVN